MRTLLAVIVTALLTSLVWLVIFNMQNCAPTVPAAGTAGTAPAAPASPATPAKPLASATLSEGSADDIAALTAKKLTIPVAGIQPAQLVDTWGQARANGRRHEAIDILAPRGTPIVAAEDGRVAKLFTSKLGGLTIYQFDPSETYSYYYAHLDHYAPGLTEGQMLHRGQVIGYVGFTGDAIESAPHLHFAIAHLDAGKHWWQGVPINPYHPLRGN